MKKYLGRTLAMAIAITLVVTSVFSSLTVAFAAKSEIGIIQDNQAENLKEALYLTEESTFDFGYEVPHVQVRTTDWYREDINAEPISIKHKSGPRIAEFRSGKIFAKPSANKKVGKEVITVNYYAYIVRDEKKVTIKVSQDMTVKYYPRGAMFITLERSDSKFMDIKGMQSMLITAPIKAGDVVPGGTYSGINMGWNWNDGEHAPDDEEFEESSRIALNDSEQHFLRLWKVMGAQGAHRGPDFAPQTVSAGEESSNAFLITNGIQALPTDNPQVEYYFKMTKVKNKNVLKDQENVHAMRPNTDAYAAVFSTQQGAGSATFTLYRTMDSVTRVPSVSYDPVTHGLTMPQLGGNVGSIYYGDDGMGPAAIGRGTMDTRKVIDTKNIEVIYNKYLVGGSGGDGTIANALYSNHGGLQMNYLIRIGSTSYLSTDATKTQFAIPVRENAEIVVDDNRSNWSQNTLTVIDGNAGKIVGPGNVKFIKGTTNEGAAKIGMLDVKGSVEIDSIVTGIGAINSGGKVTLTSGVVESITARDDVEILGGTVTKNVTAYNFGKVNDRKHYVPMSSATAGFEDGYVKDTYSQNPSPKLTIEGESGVDISIGGNADGNTVVISSKDANVRIAGTVFSNENRIRPSVPTIDIIGKNTVIQKVDALNLAEINFADYQSTIDIANGTDINIGDASNFVVPKDFSVVGTLKIEEDSMVAFEAKVSANIFSGDGIIRVLPGKLTVVNAVDTTSPILIFKGTVGKGTVLFHASEGMVNADAFDTPGITVGLKDTKKETDNFIATGTKFVGIVMDQSYVEAGKGNQIVLTASAYPVNPTVSIPDDAKIAWKFDGTEDSFKFTTEENTSTTEVLKFNKDNFDSNLATITATLVDVNNNPYGDSADHKYHVNRHLGVSKSTIKALDIPEPPPSLLVLDTKTVTREATQVYHLLAKYPVEGTAISAKSSNEQVATVYMYNAHDPRGYVFEIDAISPGTATITVTTSDGVTDTMEIIVVAKGTLSVESATAVATATIAK